MDCRAGLRDPYTQDISRFSGSVIPRIIFITIIYTICVQACGVHFQNVCFTFQNVRLTFQNVRLAFQNVCFATPHVMFGQ
jgi:hypothetical protein